MIACNLRHGDSYPIEESQTVLSGSTAESALS